MILQIQHGILNFPKWPDYAESDLVKSSSRSEPFECKFKERIFFQRTWKLHHSGSNCPLQLEIENIAEGEFAGRKQRKISFVPVRASGWNHKPDR